MKAKLALLCGALFAVACGSQSETDPGDAGTNNGAASSGSTSGAMSRPSSGSDRGGSGSGSSGSGSDSSEPEGADVIGDAGAMSNPSDASSCSSSATSTASLPGYQGNWIAGDYPSNFSAGHYLTISGVTGQMGKSREYAVHVPAGYSKDIAVPALFCIHGYGQNAVMFCLDTGVAWPNKADLEGFVVIMPNGYESSWNGGTCCGAAAKAGLDDVSLMRAIFAEVGKHVNIDLRRVYSTGFSNGGYLSYRLACEASDLFVAIAPASGAIGTTAIGATPKFGMTSDLTACMPTHKVSVLDIHGTADPLIPYSTEAPSLAHMQASNGCSTTTMPATVVLSGGDTTCLSYTGCPSCPSVSMTACSIADGGHCWFGSSDCGTGAGAIGKSAVGDNSNFMMNTDSIWAFLSRISR